MASTTASGKKKKDVNKMGYLFVAPFVITFLIFNVYPVVRTFYLSFTDYKGFGDITFQGFTNYLRVFQDKFFWISLWNTAKIWGVNIVLQLGLALALTVVFSDIKYKIRGPAVFRAMYYLPNLIAATSVAFLFRTLLDWRYGTLNRMLVSAGMTSDPINWLGSPATAPYVISVISAWMWFGNSFIMLMAGVQGISKDYFEAAAIDGAGRMKVFTRITMPLLKPIMLYVGITSLVGGLQMFDLPFLISGSTAGNPGGSTQTVVMYLYKFGFETNQVGFASAVAYVLFIIILIFSVLQFKVMYRKQKGGN